MAVKEAREHDIPIMVEDLLRWWKKEEKEIKQNGSAGA
jgi:hypothetical protein